MLSPPGSDIVGFWDPDGGSAYCCACAIKKHSELAVEKAAAGLDSAAGEAMVRFAVEGSDAERAYDAGYELNEQCEECGTVIATAPVLGAEHYRRAEALEQA